MKNEDHVTHRRYYLSRVPNGYHEDSSIRMEYFSFEKDWVNDFRMAQLFGNDIEEIRQLAEVLKIKYGPICIGQVKVTISGMFVIELI